MPNPPQGLATFPDIAHVLEASITIAHGISPSVATLVIAPQASIGTIQGTLGFSFGETLLELADCRVDRSSYQRNASGEVWQLSILDRRWKWRFGRISGIYNLWRDDYTLHDGANGTIDTRRTPRQLATLCLEAMGEVDYDVADLPNDARPSVEWNDTNPAEALAALCDRLGCRVVLQLDGRVALRVVGSGATLSADGALDNVLIVDPPELPDQIVLLGAANRYQVDFPLVAVGLEQGDAESADALVPIDELSYQPSGGWETADVPYFHQVEPALRPLAVRSVFRYYRIATPLSVPGYDGPDGDTIEKLEQIVLENAQVASVLINGQATSMPATVFGVWYPEVGDVLNTAVELMPAPQPIQADEGASLATVYTRGFSIDRARRLVIFDEPVYRNAHPSGSGSSGYEVIPAAASLVLRTACRVRDVETLALTRYTRTRDTGGEAGTLPLYLRHDEIVLTHQPQYDEEYELVDVVTNQDDVDAMADHLIDAALAEFQATAARTVRYAGLVPVELDGAIQQISVHIGGSGTTTTVSRNTESPRLGLTYRERRRLERVPELDRAAERTSPRELVRTLRANADAWEGLDT